MDLKKYTPEIIETLQKLIRIKTVLDTPVEGGPFGQGNKDCLEETLKVCEQLGFKVKNLDGYYEIDIVEDQDIFWISRKYSEWKIKGG